MFKSTDTDNYLEKVKKGFSLKDVPGNIINEEICLAAVKKGGHFLEHVPKNIINEKICLAAVKQSGFSLKDVPGNIINKEICLAAVNREGGALKYVPEDFRSYEIYLAAVRQGDHFLEHAPEDLKNKLNILEVLIAEKRNQGQESTEGLKTYDLAFLLAIQVACHRKIPDYINAKDQDIIEMMQYIFLDNNFKFDKERIERSEKYKIPDSIKGVEFEYQNTAKDKNKIVPYTNLRKNFSLFDKIIFIKLKEDEATLKLNIKDSIILNILEYLDIKNVLKFSSISPELREYIKPKIFITKAQYVEKELHLGFYNELTNKKLEANSVKNIRESGEIIFNQTELIEENDGMNILGNHIEIA